MLLSNTWMASIICFILTIAACDLAPTTHTSTSRNIILILDVPDSRGKLPREKRKIQRADHILKKFVTGLPRESNVGLIAYSHYHEQDCNNTETPVQPKLLNQHAFVQHTSTIKSSGKSSITGAVEIALDATRTRDIPTTIILIANKPEICGGNLCRTIRNALQSRINFVMHVVGIDMENEDVSQLECAVQAGGGLYFNTGTAHELSVALHQAAAIPAALSIGWLSILARSENKLADVSIRVVRADNGLPVASGRTYSSTKTNPRIFPVPEGFYDVEVEPVRFEGNIRQTFKDLEVKQEGNIVRDVDFSTGELTILVTRNGALAEADVRIHATGMRSHAVARHIHTDVTSNPVVFRLPHGRYDIEATSTQNADNPLLRIKEVTIKAGGHTSRALEFVSGTLRVGTTHDNKPIDASVSIFLAKESRPLTLGLIDTAAHANPKEFILSPGRYRVRIRAPQLPGKPIKELVVTIQENKSLERIVEFDD